MCCVGCEFRTKLVVETSYAWRYYCMKQRGNYVKWSMISQTKINSPQTISWYVGSYLLVFQSDTVVSLHVMQQLQRIQKKLGVIV